MKRILARLLSWLEAPRIVTVDPTRLRVITVRRLRPPDLRRLNSSDPYWMGNMRWPEVEVANNTTATKIVVDWDQVRQDYFDTDDR